MYWKPENTKTVIGEFDQWCGSGRFQISSLQIAQTSVRSRNADKELLFTIHTLRTQTNLNYISLSSFRTVNTLQLGTETSTLLVQREITLLCSDNHTKRANAPRGQNVEVLCVRTGGTRK